MNTITVPCPGCGREETVEVADEGVTTKTWTCPDCGRPFGVSAEWKELPDGRHLVYSVTTNSGGALTLPATVWEEAD